MNYTIPKQLLSKGESNAKLSKNAKFGYESHILYLAPARQNSLGVNICPSASVACTIACLYSAGMGAFSNVKQGRINKTEYLLHERKKFLDQLMSEVRKIAKKRRGKTSMRLNGTSDMDWIKMLKAYGYDVLSEFSEIDWYDYTKSFHRWLKYRGTRYHLTFSRSESNEAECMEVLRMGGNVAVVFDRLPETWRGYKVVDGDESDLRFLDEQNVVVGLKAKGDAKKDTSGFVVRVDMDNEATWSECANWVIEY